MPSSRRNTRRNLLRRSIDMNDSLSRRCLPERETWCPQQRVSLSPESPQLSPDATSKEFVPNYAPMVRDGKVTFFRTQCVAIWRSVFVTFHNQWRTMPLRSKNVFHKVCTSPGLFVKQNAIAASPPNRRVSKRWNYVGYWKKYAFRQDVKKIDKSSRIERLEHWGLRFKFNHATPNK